MLEILGLVFITKFFRKKIEEKKHNPKGYIISFVIVWFIFEITGAIIGFIITRDRLGAYMFALPGAGLAFIIFFIIINSLDDRRSQQEIDELSDQWICPNCNTINPKWHNEKCFKCESPKPTN